MVDADDAGLVAFEEAGGRPTVWPRDEAGDQTDAALQDVLTPYGIYLVQPVPEVISDRQFAPGLWKRNVITFDEALAFTKIGDMPAALAAQVERLPAGQRNDATLMISGSTTFE